MPRHRSGDVDPYVWSRPYRGVVKIVFTTALLAAQFATSCCDAEPRAAAVNTDTITLPAPATVGDLSVEQALLERRSVRSYRPGPLTLNELGQLLWAAQGVTSVDGFRTAPSAGALYPLEIYLVVGEVTGLTASVYRYLPQNHRLLTVANGDQRRPLAAAAFGQHWVKDAAVVVVIAAVYERTTRKYGQRGVRYVHIEVGHAAQNVFLQAAVRGLNTVVVGSFDDEAVKDVVPLRREEQPLYLMPVGR